MQDDDPPIHPAVTLALAMTAFVVLGVALALWPMLGDRDLSRDRERAISPVAEAPRSKGGGSDVEDRSPTLPAPIEPAEPRIEQGVKLTFEPVDGFARDARRARLIALYVPDGESPTPFLAPGPFTATWTGELNIELRDRFVFMFEGNGSFELTIDDEPVLIGGQRESPRTRLSQGPHKFTVRYRGPSRGPAQLRLLWKGSDFPQEPIPPTILTHDASDVELRTGERLRRGRELLATGRCFRCHAPEGEVAHDLVRDAPALFGQFGRKWVADWLMDPKAIRPDAQMPRVLHGSGERDANDIAAFLSSFGSGPTGAPWALTPDLAREGEKLYTALGCVGCHSLPGDQPHMLRERVPLDRLREKYLLSAFHFRQYLADPEGVYAWARMPDFALTDEEISALAAFLHTHSRGASADLSPSHPDGDATRGRKLVESLGCANCHAGLPVGSSLRAPSFEAVRRSDWVTGCVADAASGRGSAPDFGLSQEDRMALLAVARAGPKATTRVVPVEFAQREVEALRCNACHRYDGRVDDWTRLSAHGSAQSGRPVVPGKDAEIDQTRPMLTFAGEKLRTDYLERIIGGDLDYKPRPWMEARMPSFGIRAKWLAQGLAMMHGFPPDDDPVESPDPRKFAAPPGVGERLIGKQQGFGCTDCHGVGDQPPLNVFEAVGINFAHIPGRLRHDWYMRWMLDPLRIEPATKMPRYADHHGDTQLTDTLDGRGETQFQAIWDYLHSTELSPRIRSHEGTKEDREIAN